MATDDKRCFATEHTENSEVTLDKVKFFLGAVGDLCGKILFKNFRLNCLKEAIRHENESGCPF
jgi:hypothetical protein